ncbi:MAG TPA: PQQ-binding-like beta-propeller repeat protein [Candidatus Avipropionibacterium avicola]|uniref:PQQ-binding-like beta-propeller repeat protein n=1 Tax=Candidatus Avipropionibacterium avicola TaxID=2840701 RepID=A0A9D1GZQ6_9ACTN|nr:PQQ-binding-like beta-propeller repeat protein [Candidatus Avipropionibacterium avicola]
MSTRRRRRATQQWAPFPVQDWTRYARSSTAWRRSRRTPRLALVVTLAVVLLASGALVVADLPARSGGPTATAPHPYLPPDGSTVDAEVDPDSDDADVLPAALGSAVFATPGATQSVPAAVGTVLLGATGMRLDRPVWRQTLALADHDEYELWTAVGDLRLLAVSHPSPRGFTGGVLVLPEQARADQTWRSSGDLVVPPGAGTKEGLRWRAEFTSRADPDPDCLLVTGELLVEGRSTTELGYRWCRGRGPLEQRMVDDQGSSRTVRVVSGRDPAPVPTAHRSGQPTPATQWQGSSRSAVSVVPEVGTETMTGSPGRAIGETTAGRTVIGTDLADVLVLDPDGEHLVLRHRLYAGGWPVAVGVFGDLVVVSTGRRQLVGFDSATGRQVWRHRLPDVTTSRLWRIDDRTAALGLVNGEVWALDLVTGERRWQHAALDSGAVPVATAPGIVLSVTRTGEVVALEADTGQVRWSRQPPATVVDAVQIANARAWVFTDEGLFVHDLATGEVVGRRRALIGTVVVALDRATVLVQPGVSLEAVDETGARQWQLDLGCDPVIAHEAVLLCWHGDRVSAIDADGRVVAEQQVVEHLPGQLVATAVTGGVAWRANRTGVGTGAAWEVFTWRR